MVDKELNYSKQCTGHILLLEPMSHVNIGFSLAYNVDIWPIIDITRGN